MDVALWYQRHGSSDYELFDSERPAADYGAYMEDDGAGWVLGVQFADGRTIGRDDWAEFALARQRRDDEYRKRVAEMRAAPPVPVRKIRDPFAGKPMEIEADEPGWLGRPD